MSNFLFLKKKNNDLFKIVSEAEQLFRDEYFEQVMVQTRRFAENLCRDLLEDKVSNEDTFDDIINKIKDNTIENTRTQEVIKDLYFIKKNGNNSAHSAATNKNGEIALECLECAFEISIYYSHVKFGFDEELDKTLFSEELLITGKQTKSKSVKSNIKPEKKAKAKTKSKIKKDKTVVINELKTSKTSTKSNIVKIIFITLLLIILTIIGLFIYKFS
ncbi:MAG: DUF4145 domain-containing protein [Candidatus Gastranaerophilales bacterium]|nr:DUF4145 domain-containing protein [Candidatus Gastranaerophilales bacterium]